MIHPAVAPRGIRRLLGLGLAAAAAVLSVGSAARGASAFDALVAAAKQEGSVAVNGPPLEPAREALTAGFERAYGIKVLYESGGGPAAAARVRAERAAGKYLLDVMISGPDTPLLTFLPSGWLDRVEPVLVDPRVTDPRVWKGGHLLYADPQRTILRLSQFVTPDLAINTRLVKPGEITTWKSLLDPRWQGKFIAKDPTISGAGASLISYFYITFGPEFVKRLYSVQKPVLTRDQRQAVQWLAQGNYPIFVGADLTTVLLFQQQGYPLQMVTASDGPGILSGGFGLVSLINRAPHPNAAKLFVNWIASRDGSDAFARSMMELSLRNDVSGSEMPAYEIPRKNVRYMDTYGYEFVTVQRDAAFEKVRTLLGL